MSELKNVNLDIACEPGGSVILQMEYQGDPISENNGGRSLYFCVWNLKADLTDN